MLKYTHSVLYYDWKIMILTFISVPKSQLAWQWVIFSESLKCWCSGLEPGYIVYIVRMYLFLFIVLLFICIFVTMLWMNSAYKQLLRM